VLLLLGVVVALAAPTTTTSPPVCSAFLLGVSGVWGGANAYVTESGEFWVRRVTIHPEVPRMRERRYALELSAAERGEVADLVSRHRVARLKSSKPGAPDTPRVLLGVTPCGKPSTAVERSPYDRDIGFIAIHEWFVRQVALAEGTPAIYDGDPDPYWRPDGVAGIPNWNW
jgi:hypothetical protein